MVKVNYKGDHLAVTDGHIKGNLRLESTNVYSGAVASGTGGLNLIGVTGTKAFTLADGENVGDMVILTCSGVGGTPSGTLTPDSPHGFTTLLFDAEGESATLVWTGAGWAVVGSYGVTINT